MKTINVLGTPLTATSYDEFTNYCRHLLRENHPVAVDLTNTHIVTMRRHDPLFREITGRFDFFLPDGMPLIWCLNTKGARLHDRVYGPAFMRYCVLNSPAPYKHYLLGGSPECLTRLQQRLLAIQPALHFVGARSGYFQADEEADIVEEI